MMSNTVFPNLDEHAREKMDAVLAAPRRGLFSDLDGTLSAIAPSPAAVVVLPEVRGLLEKARDVFDLVAVVSGRPAAEVARLVQVPSVVYVGNHGLERVRLDAEHGHGRGSLARKVHPEAASYEHVIDDTLVTVKTALGRRFPGLWIEPKGVTGSIHLRAVAEPEAAEEAVYDLAQKLGASRGLRVTRGRRVVELRPPVDADKGSAVVALVREESLGGAVYIGDDHTDIDAFRALHDLEQSTPEVHGINVAVLSPEAPAELAASADLQLADEKQVPEFLTWVLGEACHTGGSKTHTTVQ
jgi:trehalose 6-phosphate phosphatase